MPLFLFVGLVIGSCFAQSPGKFSYRKEVAFENDAKKNFVFESTFSRVTKNPNTFMDTITVPRSSKPIYRVTQRIETSKKWKEYVGGKISMIEVLESSNEEWTKWKSVRANYPCGKGGKALCTEVLLFQKVSDGSVVGAGKTISKEDKSENFNSKIWIKPLKGP